MPGAGTGTPAVSAATTTAGDLITAIRPALGDDAAAVWSDEELLGYLNEAVREYSQHLPRRSTTTITAVSEQRQYALPGDLGFVTGVEYPAGSRPSSYIYAVRHNSNRFTRGRVYDVLLPRDAGTPPSLLLSFDPEPGTTLVVTYSRTHNTVLTAESVVTVPVDHHHVLLHYVLYAAARRLQQVEQADPTSSSSLLMSQLASNTRRLELTYLNALNRVLDQWRGVGEIVVW